MTSVESTPERATTLDVTQAIERPAAVTHRRIAVVPAYNEEATVAVVLERLAGLVDELVVVDDGSTDATRAEIEAWLPGHDHVRLIVHERNQGMSAAYYTAFIDLRRRIVDGEVSADDLIYTIDADGQHELAVLEELQRIMLHDGLDGNVHADRSVLLTALPLILDGLQQRGLHPVRLDQLLNRPGYVPC